MRRPLTLLLIAILAALTFASGVHAHDPPPTYEDDGSWIHEEEDDAWDGLPADFPFPQVEKDTKKQPAASGKLKKSVRYRSLILKYAKKHRLEPALVAAVIHQESAFNPRAKSPAGARGLMQLMPATARWMGGNMSKIYQAEHNISLGTRYLAYVRTVVGKNITRMAAAYNAGPGAVKKHGGVPPYAETRHYVKRIVALRKTYRRP